MPRDEARTPRHDEREPPLSTTPTDTVAVRLFEAFPDAVVLVDEAGVVRYVNRAAVALVGAARASDILGRPVWTFVHTEDVQAARESEEQLRKGRTVPPSEKQIIRLDGEAVPVEARSVPLTYRERPAVLIVARDLRGHKTLERALLASRDLFVKAFRLGPAASSILRLGDGVFIDVNEQFLELTGYARSDLIGASAVDLALWADAEAFERQRAVLEREGAVHNVSFQVRRKDGGLRHVIGSFQRIEVGGEACALGIMIDLTESVRASQSERESRALFQLVFNASLVGLGIVEVETGHVVEANAEFCRILGCGRDAIIGRPVVDLEVWATPDQRRSLAQRLRLENVVHDQVVTFGKPGEERRVALASFQLIEFEGRACVLGVLNDITERRRAEAAEQESRLLFNKIFYASPAGISITRLSDDALIEVNDAWCQLTGYTRDEVIGRSTTALALWTDGGPQRALASGPERQAVQDFEIELRRKSGEVRTTIVSLQQMHIKGEPCLLAVLVDITERKLTENKLREAKEHAEEMARLKSTFLMNLTHEIRTPLTVILGFTSILRQGVRREYLRFVQLIERSGRRLLMMLDSMLDLAQLEAGTLRIEQRPYNLSDVVQSVLQVLRPLSEDKGLRLEYHPPAGHVWARLDHAVLTRVLNNVLDNAIKFTESGGIEVQLERRGNWALLHVKDTGIGIDESFLPKVFDAFSQESTGLERTHQGTGLGLTVSQRLIELMGGRIEVTSSKGKGSTFTIFLPHET